MRFLRSERATAVVLIAAALLGIFLANTAFAPAIEAARDQPVNLFGIHLSAGHWVTDGLLAVFFFLAAIELKHELSRGELRGARRALAPTLAAIGGVVVPAVTYLAMVPVGALSRGWPIPTATDIAFALGALALVGRGLPPRIRALLLALAVIDDLIAIVIIAIFFTDRLDPLPLLAAVPVVLAFGWLSRRIGPRRPSSGRVEADRVRSALIIVVLVALGVTAWVLVFSSGVHPTIAGVAIGLVMNHDSAQRTRRALEPVSNGVILPLFAFVASLVLLPAAGVAGPSAAFIAIVVAMPLGKLIGITAGALLGDRLGDRTLPVGDILVVASLGGIGFTVSMLLTRLAFRGDTIAEGTLAVIVASIIAAAAGMTLAALRARHYRRAKTTLL